MDSTPRPRWWALLRRVVGVASIGLGISLVAAWAANFALTQAVVDALGADAIVAGMQVIGWVELGLSIVVLGGLAAGVWLHRPLWARGVASVALGMVLHWGWWLLDRRVDLFGTSALAAEDPLLASRLDARLWTSLGIDVAAVVLLLLGGVLLLRHREPVPTTAEVDEPSPAPAEHAGPPDRVRS